MRLALVPLVAVVGAVAVGLSLWALRFAPSGAWPNVALDRARPLPQGDFLVGAFPEPSHLNPLTSIDPAVGNWVVRFTHDTLREVDAVSGRVGPALAVGMVSESDGSVRIDLRTDARFADGTPVTAADVVFSHTCARAAGLPMSAMVRAAGMLSSLETTGPHALRGHGLQAHWAALDVFATGLVVLSRAAVESRLAARAREKGVAAPTLEDAALATWLAELPDAGPGSGPYRLASAAPDRGAGEPGLAWQRGRHLDLVQNPHAWRRQATPLAWNLAGFRHRFVTDRAAQLALLRGEEIDWLAGDVRALLAQDELLRTHYRVVVYDAYALGHFMVVWNCTSGPLADARVRRALASLFDRDTIVANLLSGDATPAAAWFKPGSPECPSDLAPPPYDVDAAIALLRAAGIGGDGQPPLRIEIVGAAQEPLHRRILELARPAFAAAGVDLVPQMVEAGVLRERLQRRDFMGLLAVKYHQDPWIDPWPNFHSSQAGPGGQNWMGFVDAETDRLLDAARAARDTQTRIDAHRAFCRRMHELQPVALLVHPRTALLLHRRFEDVEIGVAGLSPKLWWVRPENQLHR